MISIYFVLIVLLLYLSSKFSLIETSYTTLNRARLKRHIKEENRIKNNSKIKRMKLALSIKDKFDFYIISILLSNTCVNLLMSNLLTIIITSILGENFSFLSTILNITLLLIIGEITPKIIGIKLNETCAINNSYFLKLSSFVFYPITFVIDKILALLKKRKENIKTQTTKDEILASVEKVSETGLIDNDKKQMLFSVVNLEEKDACDVCTPRVDIIGVDIDDEIDKIIQTATECDFSRIPVYKENLDNPLGILIINDFLKLLIEKNEKNEEITPKDILSNLTSPLFVHSTMKIYDVYTFLNKKKTHMAFVSDEWGGTLGVITIDDVLEELVGEIYDEDDEIENEIVKLKNNKYLINGNISLNNIKEFLSLDTDFSLYDSNTIGGLCIEILNKFPKKGDEFQLDNLHFKVEETDKRRVTKILVSL